MSMMCVVIFMRCYFKVILKIFKKFDGFLIILIKIC